MPGFVPQSERPGGTVIPALAGRTRTGNVTNRTLVFHTRADAHSATGGTAESSVAMRVTCHRRSAYCFASAISSATTS